MKGFEDPYKSEGIVQFKIEKLSQFAQNETDSYRVSDTIYVRGLPWHIIVENDGQVELKQKVLFFDFTCNIIDAFAAGFAWSCNCSVTLRILAQKDGKEDYVQEFTEVFYANKRTWSTDTFVRLDELMNPENGWYDEATDSIILQAHITADAPHGVKNMPDDVYTEHTMRSEHALFVDLNRQYITSNLVIDGKLWSFTYASDSQTLNLEMSMHQSDTSKTIAECIFWYWKDKEIAILQKSIHTFSDSMANIVDSGMKSSKLTVPIDGATPANKKFSLVIRLLDEQIAVETNSLEPYFGNCEGIDTVTLNILSITKKKASFVVPKHLLMLASPVFQRMFANEMTEKSTGTVVIEDTNAEEFGDFLKAISPKQEQPNPSNVFALLKLADRYDCQSLRDRCELHLMNCVEIPLIHLLTCANFYGLNKLKNHLMVSLDGTGLFKLLQQTEPHFGILSELIKKIE